MGPPPPADGESFAARELLPWADPYIASLMGQLQNEADDETWDFEAKDADGSHLAVFYVDYHPRAGKRSGAWCTRTRGTWVEDGKSIRPVVANVCNFSRPAGDEPALLTLEEVGTLFHEFGHALNSLLSRSPYRGLGGFPRDFVELPSQIMENWALHPDVLKVYAKHYKTGEPIPVELVEKIKKAEQFDQGFVTVEYLAACLLDMDWHTLTSGAVQDTAAFERAAMAKIQLPPDIVPRYRSTYFNHIFGPGGGQGAVVGENRFELQNQAAFRRNAPDRERCPVPAAAGNRIPAETGRLLG